MTLLALYWSIMIVFYLVASRLRQYAVRFAFVDRVITLCVFAIVFLMGLPRYKRPRKVIFAEVPRNPTGKIEKPKLRKMYGAAGLVAKQNEIV